MKLISVIAAYCDQGDERPIFVAKAQDFSSCGFWERGAMKETCSFVARTVIPLASVGEKHSITHEGYNAYVVRSSDGLAFCVLADQDYPP
eukprot:Cvel_25607.t1-p1 / transcript=Cvel_25607.t1 / gene=Cvel_25607 / organism=Chromera_velia_CCMP2878 / gene_product=Synaptobrevin homolog YKT6, putative / transcript_product=Synaptobrevin homolog YKT6, putative / location=Cvel_scaffold2924:84-901(-) / protein_length=89 / sequence_SO=supercontig / SO=protein_coding / is_pseudo=false